VSKEQLVKKTGTEEPIPGKCGSKLRKTDPPRYCAKNPLPGRTRCNLHGGLTPRGEDSPHYKDGTYMSKYIPDQLMDKYIDASQDRALLSLREDIMVLDSIILDRLSKLFLGESGGYFKNLSGALEDLQNAWVDNPEDVPFLMNQLGDLISKGRSQSETISELTNLQLKKEKLVQSERKRLEQMHQMMSAEQVTAIIGALTKIVREEVEDQTTRTRIANKLTELMTKNNG